MYSFQTPSQKERGLESQARNHAPLSQDPISNDAKHGQPLKETNLSMYMYVLKYINTTMNTHCACDH